jgi:glycosyltransferase involved in cell wall biosynthesis
MMSFASEAMHPAIGESHVPQSDGDWAANHVRRRPEDGAPPKRLSIALVIDRIEPFYRGGYERRAWELARRLALRNQVTVFTSAPSRSIVDGVRFESVRPNVPYFKADGFRDLKANALFSLAIARRALKTQRFDIVDCNATPFLHIYPTALLAARYQAALVVTAHEALASTMDGYFRRRTKVFPALAARAAKAVYYRTQRLPALLIAASSITADELRREGFTAVDVCAGGVSGISPPKLSSSGNAIFVGRLVPNKKVALALAAFAKAAEMGSAQTLTVVGDGPDRPVLQNLARDLGVGAMVTFTGEVDEDTKLKLLIAADVFLSASPREGIAIAVLEAMSAGTPAIISHRAGVTQNGALEYLRDGWNGLVTDGTPLALASAFHRLNTDSGLYATISANATTTAGRYSWDTVADGLERIYRSVIAQHRTANGRT